jgi:hypothetical protein
MERSALATVLLHFPIPIIIGIIGIIGFLACHLSLSIAQAFYICIQLAFAARCLRGRAAQNREQGSQTNTSQSSPILSTQA